MAGAAEEAVVAESLRAFLVVVKGVEEEDGAGALIEGCEGAPAGSKTKIAPLVLKGFVLVI
jgi:hypothetical protein